jgi:prolyl 4-hydroxylase
MPTSRFISQLDNDDLIAIRELPRYTGLGVLPLTLPKELSAALTKQFLEIEEELEEDSGAVFDFNERAPTLSVLEGTPAELAVREWIKSKLEQWSNTKDLSTTSIYGARSYYRGSTLIFHVDRVESHPLSCVINVHHENLEEPWLLHVVPHGSNEVYAVDLTGENNAVLYEACTVIHGRSEPLNGDRYSNLFLHFRPDNWEQAVRNAGLM